MIGADFGGDVRGVVQGLLGDFGGEEGGECGEEGVPGRGGDSVVEELGWVAGEEGGGWRGSGLWDCDWQEGRFFVCLLM